MLFFLALALPLALTARRASPIASTVTCATGSSPARCWVKEADGVVWQETSCREALAAYDRLAGSAHPLARPVLHGVVVNGPESPRIVAARSVHVEDGYAAVVLPAPPAKARPAPRIDESGNVTADQARSMLAGCASERSTADLVTGQPLLAPTRTVSVAIFARDDLPALLVGALALLLGLAACVRRRVVVDVVPEADRLAVVERHLFWEIRRASFPLSEVVDVAVTTGASGALAGRRVELVLRDRSRAPLTEVFAPFTGPTHERLARRLRRALSR